jgi:hypothetical protein
MTSNYPFAAVALMILPWLALSNGPARAQDTHAGPFGFVRLLDAVSVGSGKLDFQIDGKSVREDGYQPGNVTGGIALKPATHQVRFRRDGVKDGETRVTVVANDTTILIPFAEQIPASEGEPARWQIRILKLKQQETENKRTASFVSVARDPELKVEIRQSDSTWQAVQVTRLGIARADIRQSRGYLPVRCKDQKLAAISVAPTGNFVVVLYDDEQGRLRSKNFQDYKYLSPD